MRLWINGEERDIRDGATVADAIRSIGADPERVAVEVNRDVVPRAERAMRSLKEGDRIEVVNFVGGG